MKYSIEDVKTQHIGIQYLQGKLNETESVAFEEFLMEHPEVLDELSLDNVFVEGINQLPEKAKEPISSKRKFWILPAVLGGAFAYASVFLFSIFSQPSLNLKSADDIVYVDIMRSSAPVQKTIQLPKSDSQIVMVLPTPFGGTGKMSVQIKKDENSKPIFVAHGLTKTLTDEIALILSLGEIIPGVYQVEVVADNEETLTFSIEFSESQ